MSAAALAQFGIRLLFGIALMLVLMPRRAVATAFFRIMLLVLLGLSVLLALTTPGEKIGPGAIAVLAFLGSVLWTLERRRAGEIVLFIIAAAALFELMSWRPIANATLHAPPALVLLSTLASAATLGATMTGMLLGHRYLTAPGMPLAPLVRVNLYLGIAAVCRCVLSLNALLYVSALHDSTAWTFLALRWLAGIIGPFAVSVMVWRILKYRNTQSATGVLFVGVILTFIGELTADLLFRDTGIPF
jgi:hypothetical protein